MVKRDRKYNWQFRKDESRGPRAYWVLLHPFGTKCRDITPGVINLGFVRPTNWDGEGGSRWRPDEFGLHEDLRRAHIEPRKLREEVAEEMVARYFDVHPDERDEYLVKAEPEEVEDLSFGAENSYLGVGVPITIQLPGGFVLRMEIVEAAAETKAEVNDQPQPRQKPMQQELPLGESSPTPKKRERSNKSSKRILKKIDTAGGRKLYEILDVGNPSAEMKEVYAGATKLMDKEPSSKSVRAGGKLERMYLDRCNEIIGETKNGDATRLTSEFLCYLCLLPEKSLEQLKPGKCTFDNMYPDYAEDDKYSKVRRRMKIQKLMFYTFGAEAADMIFVSEKSLFRASEEKIRQLLHESVKNKNEITPATARRIVIERQPYRVFRLQAVEPMLLEIKKEMGLSA